MTLEADEVTLLARASFDGEALAARHPPKLQDANKKLIHAIATPVRGQIEVTRWKAGSLPARVPSRACEWKSQAGVFDYAAAAPGSVAWHVNFADANLFYAYGSGLFAQDEHQVAEHPVLASLRESLVAEPIAGLVPLTTEGERATPVLVKGAERSCAIATSRGGRSIYGNAMHRATLETIRSLVARLDPATVSNILAMEAPAGGSGRYSPAEISTVVSTAFTGFTAARLESQGASVVIHTGHWGCGAYGGNHRLMALLQLLAARLAQLDTLVFHTFDAAGAAAYVEAREHADRLVVSGALVGELFWQIDDLGYRWGSSDGN